jgi:adenine-specific DNA-methyltransferase
MANTREARGDRDENDRRQLRRGAALSDGRDSLASVSAPPAADVDTSAARKARGAFFTPPELASFVADWAIERGDERVLEPSCGEASFLMAAAEVLTARRGGRRPEADQLHGVELHEQSKRNAEQLLADAGYEARVDVGDFFTTEHPTLYQAAIGNPPYVRYQDFAGEARAASRLVALDSEIELTAQASSWAAFVVRATQLLDTGGRLGLVLPGELLTVNYAAPVRRHLLESYRRVRLVVFEERVFPGVLQEVVLLLAEGKGEGPAQQIEMHPAMNGENLKRAHELEWISSPAQDDRWISALVDADVLGAYMAAAAGAGWTNLLAWGDPTLGMVTGNNKWFLLTEAQRLELGLKEGRDVLRMAPPGSKHLKGLSFSLADWEARRKAGERVWLFRPGEKPSAPARRRILDGEVEEANDRYKCRIRKLWWQTPFVPAPQLFITYMNHHAPRLVWNGADLRHVNSVHGLRLSPGIDEATGKLLSLAALNSLTLLGAELVGRAYGGGVLKLEPKEADRLPVPTPAAVERMRAGLEAIVAAGADGRLREGDLWGVVADVDAVLLADLDADQRALLARGRRALARRREARGGTGKRSGADRRPADA